MKKYLLIFVLAFGLNWIWENLHSRLYLHYQNGEISQLVLTRAALADAVFILIIVFISYQLPDKFRSAFVILAGLALAGGIELWALSIERWMYTEAMPLVPILNIGFTPFIQLALTGWAALRVNALYDSIVYYTTRK